MFINDMPLVCILCLAVYGTFAVKNLTCPASFNVSNDIYLADRSLMVKGRNREHVKAVCEPIYDAISLLSIVMDRIRSGGLGLF